MSHSKVHFLCALYRSGEWLWVDSSGTDGKPTFRRRANQSWLSNICIHFGKIAAWSRKSLTTFTQQLTFLEKDPLRTSFHKCFPKGFTISQIHVLSADFVKFGWPEIGKVVRCLLDKKTKFPLAVPLSLLRGSRPKSVRGIYNIQKIYSEYPKFHPNPFTSGGVIARRVNIVQTRHKVFPILGEVQLLHRVKSVWDHVYA